MPKLYNTLSRKTEDLKPINDSSVGLYTCGPTVYDYAHIGNLRTYIFEDLLRRVLEYNGLPVKHAMNITDVGHLTSDADAGEDKMEKGAAREGKHPLEVAKFYEQKFIEDADSLNILRPTEGYIRATDTIADQIEIIKILEEKGFIYKDEAAIYFDTSKLPDYGKLSRQKLSDKKIGAREDVVIDQNKKNPQDFVLWFFTTGKYKNHVLRWPSPWGEGFPGWHIECSAISRKVLGQPFDIHTGGVDHIGTHHTNEIAQSEAAFDVPLANIWMHGEFLLIDSGRMGKSEGNSWTLDYLKEKGFNPLYYRYLALTAHYRTQLNFSWSALEAAKEGLEGIYDYSRILLNTKQDIPTEKIQKAIANYEDDFLKSINDDLNIPNALGIFRKFLKDKTIPNSNKLETSKKFDKVFALSFDKPLPRNLFVSLSETINVQDSLSVDIQSLAQEREQARKNKDFAKSDDLRKQIEDLGYELMDTPEGQKVRKK